MVSYQSLASVSWMAIKAWILKIGEFEKNYINKMVVLHFDDNNINLGQSPPNITIKIGLFNTKEGSQKCALFRKVNAFDHSAKWWFYPLNHCTATVCVARIYIKI